MITEEQLKSRLHDWGAEYRGGRYEHVGWHSKNILQVCHEHKGFRPDSRGRVPIAINTPADEVEAAVTALQVTPGEPLKPNVYFRAAMSLRVCYVAPSYWAEEERLRQLRRVGIAINKTAYYEALKIGRRHVASVLSCGKAA